jgi:hypothetical protein
MDNQLEGAMGIELETTEADGEKGFAAEERIITMAERQLFDQIANGKKLVVDAEKWHRLVYLAMTHPEGFIGHTPQARLLMFGRIRGGETLSDCTAFWEETKEFVKKLQP